MQKDNNLSELDLAVLAYIDSRNFVTAREITNELKIDLALSYKSLNILLSENYISSDNERPKNFKSLLKNE